MPASRHPHPAGRRARCVALVRLLGLGMGLTCIALSLAMAAAMLTAAQGAGADRPAGPPRPAREPGDAAARPGRPGPPPPRGGPGPHGYSIEQAVSDRAQLTTIAFSGLAFITGDFGASTFLPPGKVCDYFGFQYMRDIDARQAGHNTSFLTRIANNVLYLLNDAQFAQLKTLAINQMLVDKPCRPYSRTLPCQVADLGSSGGTGGDHQTAPGSDYFLVP